MKRKVNKRNYPELDKFDRKQKKHSNSKSKSSARKPSIYDEFDDPDLEDYQSVFDDYDDE